MPTIVERIEDYLNTSPLRDQLTPLFTQALAWGTPKEQPRTIELSPSAWGGDEPLHLTLRPVAQLSGIPVFRADWPFTSLPNLMQRRAVNKALASVHLEHLVCYVTSDNLQAAFVWARSRNGKTELRTLPYEVGSPARTTLEQLANLGFTYQELGISGEPLLTLLLDKLNAAFDVEAVTKRFFKKYGEIFDHVEASITGLTDKAAKRLFTQRLFNRLMFIAFIQRKGWLKLGASRDYLSALWDSYRRDPNPTGNFYNSRLKLLFFVGLNNSASQDFTRDAAGIALREVIGEVPYLNGGLFEMLPDDEDPAVAIPDDAIEPILDELFSRFNFTVTESTPLDVEVAVDPEMLGKVFEELVTGRHEIGSYYTPKPIVSFMCREALKGYLKKSLPNERPQAVDAFVDQHSPADLRDPEAVLSALKVVTVCDPACGSGAYLLGMLHELLDLRQALFANGRHLDPITTYERKLEIIQNNLYGVDLDPFAVNIARLRLWLSLAVDFEGAKPEPLPNLDFKIEAGDSVTGPAPSPSPLDSFRNHLINDYLAAKELYLRAHGQDKPGLRDEIHDLKAQIHVWTYGDRPAIGFDWQVEFAEVFYGRGGFDIIVANPPYVRQELIKDLKPALKAAHPDVYTGVADLYVYFYSRALQLLRPGGMLAFISSNKWFRANYGAPLRKHIANTCHVLSITDFGDLPVFESATAYPMIFIAQKEAASMNETVLTEVSSLGEPYPDVLALTSTLGRRLPSTALAGEDWLLTNDEVASNVNQMRDTGIRLDDYVKRQLYVGIKTGLNRAFWIDNSTRARLIAEDPKSGEVIKAQLVGKDIKKWNVQDADRWIIFTRRGTRIDDYPAVKEYLAQWRALLTPKINGDEELGRKPGRYKWYEIQDEVAYYREFEKPKIVFPDIAKEPRFAFDPHGFYVDMTAFVIPVDDLYLLGTLNSSSVTSYFLEIGAQVRGGYLRFKRQYVEDIPIPNAPTPDRTAIADLVQHCLDLKGVGCEEYEREINERVARLYGL
jgi:type I restriction-modification system DNA methylase subunit